MRSMREPGMDGHERECLGVVIPGICPEPFRRATRNREKATHNSHNNWPIPTSAFICVHLRHRWIASLRSCSGHQRKIAPHGRSECSVSPWFKRPNIPGIPSFPVRSRFFNSRAESRIHLCSSELSVDCISLRPPRLCGEEHPIPLQTSFSVSPCLCGKKPHHPRHSSLRGRAPSIPAPKAAFICVHRSYLWTAFLCALRASAVKNIPSRFKPPSLCTPCLCVKKPHHPRHSSLRGRSPSTPDSINSRPVPTFSAGMPLAPSTRHMV